jgi:ABC-type uncharacterized transport system substrate-binding protein
VSFILNRWLSILILTLSGFGSALAADASVVVVSVSFNAAYQEAASAVVSELKRKGISEKDVQLLTVSQLLGFPQKPVARLYVALGVEASELLAKTEFKVPVLSALLPQSGFERILLQSGRKPSAQFSALYLNQALTRQVDLIQLAMPDAHKVGVMLGSVAHPSQQMALADAVKSRGLVLVSHVLAPEESIFTGLKSLLDESDVILALPDPQIYNSNSIQNILLSSFRAQIPMVAFSPAYVRAGALLAVYSTPGQIGKQAGEMVFEVLQGRPLSSPQYPGEFTISVNDQVARSLGFKLEAEVLSERLLRLEKRR